MHQRLVSNSDALASSMRTLNPAMWGCPDCGTATMIATSHQVDDCPDCRHKMTVLSPQQVAAAVKTQPL